VKVYLFEPVPRNVERLKENLKGFEIRYEIKECAIGVKEGRADFASEETGRYGGLIADGPSHLSQCPPERRIEVEVQSANKVLMDILGRQDSIDILKIDVEGFEAEILAHLEMDVLGRVNRIYAEMTTVQKVSGFLSERYGGVTRYYRA
jgi:FkbM family methyltransferase